MSRRRLAILTPDYPPTRGGIQYLLERLVLHLTAYDRLVVARGTGEASKTIEERVRVVRTRRKRKGLVSLAALNRVALRECSRFRPDIVILGHVALAPTGALLRWLWRRPIVTYLHADELPGHPWLTRLALRTSSGTIAVSAYTRDLAAAFGPMTNCKVIPPGVDYADAPGNSDEGNPATVLTVARLSDVYKGHDVMLRAIALLQRSVPHVRWVVVGDGPLRAELEIEAQRQHLDGHVLFVGAVSDAERDAWYARAQVFAMPSRLPEHGKGGEGFGIVYLEAGMRGLPSVAGNVGGATDAVTHEETGLLVDPSSAEEISTALQRLLEDDLLRDRLGRQARAHALAMTWPRIAARVDEVLRASARP